MKERKTFKQQIVIEYMDDEMIDICDENNNLLGIQKLKREVHREGLWHRTVHVWIYNSKKEILLQLRAKEKPTYPDRWDISAAGHISAGEEPITSARREVKEEVGLNLKKEDLIFWTIRKIKSVFKKIKDNEFYYVYFFKFDGSINELKLQKEEVQEIKFLPITKLEEELKENPDKYVPHGSYWSDVLTEVKNKLNC